MDSLTVAEGRIRPVCGTQPVKGLLFLYPVFPVGWGGGKGRWKLRCPDGLFLGRYPAVAKSTGDSVPGPVSGFWEQAEQIGKRFLNLQPEKGL